MRARRSVLTPAAVLAVAALAAASLPASAADPVSAHLLRPLVGVDSATFPGAQEPVGDVDLRGDALPPLASALAEVARLGDDVQVSWNQYGTPRTLVRVGGWLAESAPGLPDVVARDFLRARAGLLGLTAADVDALELTDTVRLSESDAYAVRFRQRLGGLPLVQDGLVTVGTTAGKVASVTSSAVGRDVLGTLSATTPRIGPAQAVLTAARDAGVTTLALDDLTVGKLDLAGFTNVLAPGLAQVQRTRLRALPTTSRGTRLVWETDVLDVHGHNALATITFVDALTGEVLLRRDAVDTAAPQTASVPGMRAVATRATGALPATQAAPPSGGTFSGAYSREACSALLPIDVPAGTRSIVVTASAVLPSNDIVLNAFRNGQQIGSGDLLTTPEVLAVALPEASAGSDAFAVQVCPYDTSSSAPFDFYGTYATSDLAAPAVPGLPSGVIGDGSQLGPPTWRYFPSNPTLPQPDVVSPDDRALVCGTARGATSTKPLDACDVFTYRDASPFPYDVDAVTGLPTFATIGNNAVTTNAQLSTSLTPGPPALPVLSASRDFAPDFTDSWHQSSCDPLSILDPTRNRADVDASTVNLFVGHNRTHDFAYRLGLTETTGALQTSNFGKGGMEGDPEIGNAQNAAATNPVFTVTNPVTVPTTGLGLAGRNNANQITLQDGVPGITNQYLFQPIVGFYGPCADGGLDASIWLHEYAHAISNRLVGGPDNTLSGQQSGSMGESWSDLIAVEFLQAFDVAGKRGEDPFAVGAYATGDPLNGIRNYNTRPDRNPLTYAELGYDATGPSVHSDGEIWNGTNTTVRQALQRAYDDRFPSGDAALQEACALGRDAAGQPHSGFEGCPGNRRWVQYLFDGMILQASGSPTMVDIKNTMLASVLLRGGADTDVVADAFASRGLGADASAVDAADTDPVPGFASPTAARNATVTFRLVDAVDGSPVAGSVHAGTYQARTTPVATTLGEQNPDPVADFVAGEHSFVVQAPGYGLQRFTETFVPGARTVTFALDRNVASGARGATADGDGGARLEALIDDDEATNGGFDGVETDTPVAGREVTVALDGFHRIDRIAVSALHRPLDPEVEGDFQGRLLGLRAFDLQASTDGGESFTTVYRSPDAFFPAGRPRPTAPDLNLRTVALPEPVVADALRLVVRSNQCTGAPEYQGEQEVDPLSDSACETSANALRVTVTELQAFGVAAAAPTGPTTPVAGEPGPVAGAPAPSRGNLPATGASAALGLAALVLVGGGLLLARRRSA